MGPTRVWYLLGAGASEEEPTVGLPWAATVVNKVGAAVGAARATAATVAGSVGDAAMATVGAAGDVMEETVRAAGGAAAGGGEELRTLGQKA